MSKSTRFHCDGPNCGKTADESAPSAWRLVTVKMENLRREVITRDKHYCEKCFPKFQTFMNADVSE